MDHLKAIPERDQKLLITASELMRRASSIKLRRICFNPYKGLLATYCIKQSFVSRAVKNLLNMPKAYFFRGIDLSYRIL